MMSAAGTCSKTLTEHLMDLTAHMDDAEQPTKSDILLR
jgi:hypothetical protein